MYYGLNDPQTIHLTFIHLEPKMLNIRLKDKSLFTLLKLYQSINTRGCYVTS